MLASMPMYSRRLQIVLAGGLETVEQRAADVGLALGDAALLGLHAADLGGHQIDDLPDLIDRRRNAFAVGAEQTDRLALSASPERL